MAKLPENFGMEEPVVHPYRALVVTIAVIIGVSLFAGGMFYGSMRTKEESLESETAISKEPSAPIALTDDIREKFLTDTQAPTGTQETIPAGKLNALITTEAKPTGAKGTLLTNQQRDNFFKQ